MEEKRLLLLTKSYFSDDNDNSTKKINWVYWHNHDCGVELNQ